MLAFWLPFGAQADEPAHSTLLDAFLAVDTQFLEASHVGAARVGFERLVDEASPCAVGRQTSQDRARCVFDAIFAALRIDTIGEPSGPESSTVTSALTSRRGNCAALTAVALALAERAGVPMEAIVYPHHVVVRAHGNGDEVFEMLDRGAGLTVSQLRARLGADGALGIRVHPRSFPAFYLDNLAVRFAQAGDRKRAEGLFAQALEASPRAARIHFNYGTFLLETNRAKPAAEELRRAVRLERNDAQAWANLGVAHARLGETEKARRCFQRALRSDPANLVAAENLRSLDPGGSPPNR